MRRLNYVLQEAVSVQELVEESLQNGSKMKIFLVKTKYLNFMLKTGSIIFFPLKILQTCMFLIYSALRNNVSSEALPKNSSALASASVKRLVVRTAAKELPET